MGAEAVKTLLEQLDLDDLSGQICAKAIEQDQQQAEDQGPHQAAQDRSRAIRNCEQQGRSGWSWK